MSRRLEFSSRIYPAPVRDVDHEIELDPCASPPSRSPYRLPKPEQDELQRQLTVLLERGFIEPSKSPFGAPVFFC